MLAESFPFWDKKSVLVGLSVVNGGHGLELGEKVESCFRLTRTVGLNFMLPPPSTQFNTSLSISSVGALLVAGVMDRKKSLVYVGILVKSRN